jgi:hypothetical protein
LIAGFRIPSRPINVWSGDAVITGILWSYVEEDRRKVHAHMVAPNLEFMLEQFGIYFEQVEIIRYPPTFPGWEGRPALVARRKRLTSLVPREPLRPASTGSFSEGCATRS